MGLLVVGSRFWIPRIQGLDCLGVIDWVVIDG